MLCLIDNTAHADLAALHKHLRKVKVKQEDYYTQYAPRRDLATGEIIPFKAPAEQYLKREFISKVTLKRYLKEQPGAGKEWAINWLRQRKMDKELVYPPTQVELRSLLAPGIAYYDHIGGYNQICADLGYTVRFDGAASSVNPLGCSVIIDTREQNPLKLKCPFVKGTLTCGDYGLPAEHDKGIYIERKSLQDFVGTLSDRKTRQGDSNLARFTRELERAQESGAYIVMLVETDINQALGFSHLPHMKHCKVREEHIFKNLRDLLVRFSHFQALFVSGRIEAAVAVERLLGMGESVKQIDLQYQYEKGDITFE